jgi:hypothetical protein
LELGARYLITDNFAFELGIISVSTTDNKTSRLTNNIVVKDEWRITNRYIAAGVESIYGSFGYGVQIGYSKWKYLKDFVGTDSKQAVLNENSFNARFNLIIQVKSDNNAFALKPFYNYPLSKINISSVDKTLNGSTNDNIQENFESFGMSFIFYNGRQR